MIIPDPKTDKPLFVIKHKLGKGHRRETRVFARNIHEVFCMDVKCEFSGKHAQQGICYSNKPEITDWDKIEQIGKRNEEDLAHARKSFKGKKYIEWLEAMHLSTMMNWTFTLDEVVRLRRDNALLKLKVKK